MNVKSNYAAILGYGAWCNEKNANLAYACGSLLARKKIVVCAGNTGGTFENAFKGAKDNSGRICLIAEAGKVLPNNDYFDIIEIASSTDEKHQLISEKCYCGIVIGGGQGTRKIINRFLSKNKLIVAIKGTGDILDKISEKGIYFVENAADAINHVLLQR